MKRPLLLVASGLGLGLLAAACNPATPYAAIVNGQVISQSELSSQLAAIAGNPSDVASIESASQSQGGPALQIAGPQPGTYGMRFATEALNQDIEFAVIHQEFVRRRLTLSSYELQSARADLPSELSGPGQPPVHLGQFPPSYQKTLVTRQAEIMALEASIARVDVTPQAVQSYYASHLPQMYEACASRIVVPTLAAAAGVLSDLAHGTGFAAEASAKSQDTSTSANGGQLGCGTGLAFASSFGSAFAQQVGSAPLNKPVGPVLDPSGFNIIDVTARQPLTASAAQAQIRQQLVSAGASGLQAVLSRALRTARVVVDSRYGSWTAVSAGAGVVPPPIPKVRNDSVSAGPSSGPGASWLRP